MSYFYNSSKLDLVPRLFKKRLKRIKLSNQKKNSIFNDYFNNICAYVKKNKFYFIILLTIIIFLYHRYSNRQKSDDEIISETIKDFKKKNNSREEIEEQKDYIPEKKYNSEKYNLSAFNDQSMGELNDIYSKKIILDPFAFSNKIKSYSTNNFNSSETPRNVFPPSELRGQLNRQPQFEKENFNNSNETFNENKNREKLNDIKKFSNNFNDFVSNY